MPDTPPTPGPPLPEGSEKTLEGSQSEPGRRSRMPDQRSVTEQLRDLVGTANRLGMYDAADWLSLWLQGRP